MSSPSAFNILFNNSRPWPLLRNRSRAIASRREGNSSVYMRNQGPRFLFVCWLRFVPGSLCCRRRPTRSFVCPAYSRPVVSLRITYTQNFPGSAFQSVGFGRLIRRRRTRSTIELPGNIPENGRYYNSRPGLLQVGCGGLAIEVRRRRFLIQSRDGLRAPEPALPRPRIPGPHPWAGRGRCASP